MALLFGCTPIGKPHPKADERDASMAQAQQTEAPDKVSPACTSAENCRADGPCSEARCKAGACTTELKAAGDALAASQQKSGDCQKRVCNADGTARDAPDDSDVPNDDSNPCHKQQCVQGELKTENVANGTVCNGAGQCAAGKCSSCGEGTDCSRAGDCTVYRVRCRQDMPSCEDTGEPRVDTRCKSVAPRSCEGAGNDGMACGDSAVCRAGACVHSALVNGDFSHGLTGWTLEGAAATFMVAPDESNFQRMSLSTSTDGTSHGGAAQGTVSQTFIVPMDAVAIRFNVFGGHAHVRLKDARGTVLQSCTGLDSNDIHVPVSWDLLGKRGQSLVIAIEDDLSPSDWGYVSTTGFDVLRQVDPGLVNSQFSDGFAGWEASGDGPYFQVFDDYNSSTGRDALTTGDASYGKRRSVTTYTVDRLASGLGESSQGLLRQSFSVPNDAVALRFNVHGGRAARITLREGTRALYTVTANNSDSIKTPVSWLLAPHRGKTLSLSIEDDSTSAYFGYIGCSGFDVITNYNGP